MVFWRFGHQDLRFYIIHLLDFFKVTIQIEICTLLNFVSIRIYYKTRGEILLIVVKNWIWVHRDRIQIRFLILLLGKRSGYNRKINTDFRNSIVVDHFLQYEGIWITLQIFFCEKCFFVGVLHNITNLQVLVFIWI